MPQDVNAVADRVGADAIRRFRADYPKPEPGARGRRHPGARRGREHRRRARAHPAGRAAAFRSTRSSSTTAAATGPARSRGNTGRTSPGASATAARAPPSASATAWHGSTALAMSSRSTPTASGTPPTSRACSSPWSTARRTSCSARACSADAETRDRCGRRACGSSRVLVRLLTGVGVTDTSSGLRAMVAEVGVSVRQEQVQYQSSELLLGAIFRGLPGRRAAGGHAGRAAGESKKGHNALYGLRYARAILRTWWRERRCGRPRPACGHR